MHFHLKFLIAFFYIVLLEQAKFIFEQSHDFLIDNFHKYFKSSFNIEWFEFFSTSLTNIITPLRSFYQMICFVLFLVLILTILLLIFLISFLLLLTPTLHFHIFYHLIPYLLEFSLPILIILKIAFYSTEFQLNT